MRALFIYFALNSTYFKQLLTNYCTASGHFQFQSHCHDMFHSSTQKQHWLFKDEEELRKLREKANLSFCAEHESAGAAMLDSQEEVKLLRYYQKKLVEVCNLFAPPKWVPLPRTALVSEQGVC